LCKEGDLDKRGGWTDGRGGEGGGGSRERERERERERKFGTFSRGCLLEELDSRK